MEQNSGQQARLDIGQLRFCAGCGHSGIDDFVSSTLQGCEYIGVAIRGASFVNHCDSHLDNPFSGLPIGRSFINGMRLLTWDTFRPTITLRSHRSSAR
jgi:hypothetical protein